MAGEKKKKKSSRRSNTTRPGLKRELNPKSRWELLDFDYIGKLSEKEKDFLNKFAEEYIHGSFEHNRKDLHKTKKSKRECYNRNNARNRDLYTISRTNGWIANVDASANEIENQQFRDNTEDNLITLLDLKNSKKD